MSKQRIGCVLLATLVLVVTAQIFGQANQDATRQSADKLIGVLKSDAPRYEKAEACRQLGLVGGSEAIAPLAMLLGDEELSHMARYGLEPIPDPAVDDALRDSLGKLNGGPLVGAIGSIGVRRDVKTVEPLIGLLDNADADVAQAAARALGSIGTTEAEKALRAALADAPAGNQLALFEGLFRCGERLAARGQDDEAMRVYDRVAKMAGAPHQVRAGAVRGAILVRQRVGLPLFGVYLGSKDYAMFAAACQAAQEMPGDEVTQYLLAALPGVSADHQVVIIQTLGKRANPAALSTINKLAISGEKPVRLAAIRSMAQIGDKSGAVPTLKKLAADSDAEIAQAAKESLARFADAPTKE